MCFSLFMLIYHSRLYLFFRLLERLKLSSGDLNFPKCKLDSKLLSSLIFAFLDTLESEFLLDYYLFFLPTYRS